MQTITDFSIRLSECEMVFYLSRELVMENALNELNRIVEHGRVCREDGGQAEHLKLNYYSNNMAAQCE